MCSVAQFWNCSPVSAAFWYFHWMGLLFIIIIVIIIILLYMYSVQEQFSPCLSAIHLTRENRKSSIESHVNPTATGNDNLHAQPGPVQMQTRCSQWFGELIEVHHVFGAVWLNYHKRNIYHPLQKFWMQHQTLSFRWLYWHHYHYLPSHRSPCKRGRGVIWSLPNCPSDSTPKLLNS